MAPRELDHSLNWSIWSMSSPNNVRIVMVGMSYARSFKRSPLFSGLVQHSLQQCPHVVPDEGFQDLKMAVKAFCTMVLRMRVSLGGTRADRPSTP